MDTRSVALIVIAGCAAGVMIIKIIADAVLRARAMQVAPDASQIGARLGRIEAAIDSMAVEIERHGEMQRFAASSRESVAALERSRPE